VRAWMLRFEIVVVASVVVPMTARFPVVVRFETVVDERVLEPVAKRLLRVAVPEIVVEAVVTERSAAFWAVMLPSVVEARVEDPVAKRFCVLVVVAFVVVALSVWIFPVVDQRVVMVARGDVIAERNAEVKDAMPPVMLVTVVLARVEEPATERVPESTMFPELRAVAAIVPAVTLASVVEARVVDPTTWREVVAMIDPAMSLPWAVVEARDVEVVAVREPIVSEPVTD
jgi:hypothetical protein